MRTLLNRPRRGLMAFLLIVSAATSAVWACNVPVFRYALENWRPDAYRLTVFHQGPLSDTDRALIQQYDDRQASMPLNLAVRTVDIAEIDNSADRELMATISQPQWPMFVVQYPAHLHLETPVHSGSLTSDALAQLVDSPVRQELVRRLADGQTAVWLMVDSGKTGTDDQAAELLATELPLLSTKLKLPELTDSPEDVLRGAPPLRLTFSLLRVSRKDVAEQPLVAMLLGSEPDLATEAAPLVFPVFGRCRALLPLVGAGITPENIRSSAAFLAGACSCQVKELNPGFDLLIAADWDTLLKLDGISLATTNSSSSGTSEEPEFIPIPRGTAAAASTPSASTTPAKTTTPTGWSFTSGLLLLSVMVLIVVSARR